MFLRILRWSRREDAKQSSLGKRTVPQPSKLGIGFDDEVTAQPIEEWPISKENVRGAFFLGISSTFIRLVPESRQSLKFKPRF